MLTIGARTVKGGAELQHIQLALMHKCEHAELELEGTRKTSHFNAEESTPTRIHSSSGNHYWCECAVAHMT